MRHGSKRAHTLKMVHEARNGRGRRHVSHVKHKVTHDHVLLGREAERYVEHKVSEVREQVGHRARETREHVGYEVREIRKHASHVISRLVWILLVCNSNFL